jgi:hypothetical protein
MGTAFLLVFLLGVTVGAVVLAPRRGAEAPPPTGPVAGGGFVDRAREAGVEFRMSFLPGEQGEKFKINFYDHGAGVSVADVDGDGDDDLYFCNQLGPNALYRNEGGGRFVETTKAAGVGLEDRVSVASAFGDADGDGDQDLYVATTRGGNVFYRNRGDGTFEDATEAAGLSLVLHSQAATFFDADRDGDLDLLVANTAKWTTDVFDEQGRYYVGPERFFDLVLKSPGEANRFYRNRGDGRFDDATMASGLQGTGWSGDVTVFDKDGDGDPDVFVANMFGRSHLYENDGRGRFVDVAAEALPRASWGTVGSKAFDHDGDGLLDLFLVDMHSDMWMDETFDPTPEIARTKYASVWGPRGARLPQEEALFASTFAADPAKVSFGNTLFRNLGGGRFDEVSGRAGVESFWPWGAATGDFDADGHEDVFVPSGMGYPFPYWPSPLFMNRGNGTFEDRAREWGLDPPPGGRLLEQRIGGRESTRGCRAAATADFDGDGRLDLVVANFNDRPSLLMNRAPKRRYVGFRLVGTASPRDATGAIVKVRSDARWIVRQVSSATGYLAQSSRTLHFGLGDSASIDAVEIRWPSGLVQSLPPPPVDAVHVVVEPRR